MRLALALAATAVSFAAFAADPVAFVADIQGNATIEGDGKVAFLAELPAGTRLLLGTGAKVSVTYASSGNEFTIRGPGEFLVGPSEVKAEKGAAPTRRSVASLPDTAAVARISQTATASLRMRSLPPPASKAALQYPVDTRVATLQPVLRWHDGADPVEVTLRDAQGREVWKGAAKAGTAQPAVKLSPAMRYRWTVMTPKGAIGEAQFETLGADALAKVAKSRSAAKGFSERVMHAMLLQDFGATQEAREAWRELARERPELPELAALARGS
jgi:hypothetical protein